MYFCKKNSTQNGQFKYHSFVLPRVCIKQICYTRLWSTHLNTSSNGAAISEYLQTIKLTGKKST